MKKIITTLMLFVAIGMMATGLKAGPSETADKSNLKVENRQTATATITQEMGVIQVETEKQSIGEFLSVNWGILSLSLLSFLEVVTRLTPSEKDNTVLKFLSNILNAIIPNRKKGGGSL